MKREGKRWDGNSLQIQVESNRIVTDPKLPFFVRGPSMTQKTGEKGRNSVTVLYWALFEKYDLCSYFWKLDFEIPIVKDAEGNDSS